MTRLKCLRFEAGDGSAFPAELDADQVDGKVFGTVFFSVAFILQLQAVRGWFATGPDPV